MLKNEKSKGMNFNYQTIQNTEKELRWNYLERSNSRNKNQDCSGLAPVIKIQLIFMQVFYKEDRGTELLASKINMENENLISVIFNSFRKIISVRLCKLEGVLDE